MQRKTRSILEELNNIAVNQDSVHLIESSGDNIIRSAINLIEKFYSMYEYEEALDLERRFLNSIKSKDPKKFERGIKKIKNS